MWNVVQAERDAAGTLTGRFVLYVAPNGREMARCGPLLDGLHFDEARDLAKHAARQSEDVAVVQAEIVDLYIAMVESEADDWDDPDAAYERHLEDQGYEEARADEAREQAMGVVPFADELAAARRDAGEE